MADPAAPSGLSTDSSLIALLAPTDQTSTDLRARCCPSLAGA
jgi:hypothetical protein